MNLDVFDKLIAIRTEAGTFRQPFKALTKLPTILAILKSLQDPRLEAQIKLFKQSLYMEASHAR